MLLDSPCPCAYGQHQLNSVRYRSREDEKEEEEEVDKENKKWVGRCGAGREKAHGYDLHMLYSCRSPLERRENKLNAENIKQYVLHIGR